MSTTFELAVVEWPPGGRPQVLGRLHDADILAEALARLAQRRASEVARLEEGLAASPVRLVRPEEPAPPDPDAPCGLRVVPRRGEKPEKPAQTDPESNA